LAATQCEERKAKNHRDGAYGMTKQHGRTEDPQQLKHDPAPVG